MSKKSVLVGQSGGPTTVINASLAGVLETSLASDKIENVYGVMNGIKGILDETIIDVSKEDKDEIHKLLNTPSSMLGSVRYKLPSYLDDDTDYKKIKEVFEKLNIGHFFYIGGNDSMDTCNKINEYFKHINFDCTVFGVPKTVDNDLILTDHTPGYGSSIKFIANTVAEIYQDISCYKKGKVTIVEIMGRDAGWLTAGTKLASLVNNGPDLIYLPEVAFDMESFLEKVDTIYKQKGHALITISEGIRDSEGNYILTYSASGAKDEFGHMQLGGVASVLTNIVSTRLHLPTRSIELNLPQRCASHLASLTDIEEAYNLGKNALLFSLDGVSGKMSALERVSSNPYEVKYTYVDLTRVANSVKEVPLNYISKDGSQITNEFIEYALPLIKGNISNLDDNGLVKFAKFNKNFVKL